MEDSRSDRDGGERSRGGQDEDKDAECHTARITSAERHSHSAVIKSGMIFLKRLKHRG